MDDQTRMADLEKKVGHLEMSYTQFDKLIERFDISIERLTEVSTTVSQLLAVQGSRLEFQEKTSDELTKMLEQRRKESENVIRDVYNKIDKVEKELMEDIDTAHNKILAELKELKSDVKTNADVINKKVEALEKWQWRLIGGAVVFGIVATYFDTFARLFG